MTLDAHLTGIWCGQIGGGVGKLRLGLLRMQVLGLRLGVGVCIGICRNLGTGKGNAHCCTIEGLGFRIQP